MSTSARILMLFVLCLPLTLSFRIVQAQSVVPSAVTVAHTPTTPSSRATLEPSPSPASQATKQPQPTQAQQADPTVKANKQNAPQKQSGATAPKNKDGFSLNSIITFFQNLPPSVNIGTLGAVIPALLGLIGWFTLKRKKNRFKHYFSHIDDTYAHYKLEGNKCEAELHAIKALLDEQLKKGKLEENNYQILEGRISGYLKELRRQLVQEQFSEIPTQLMGTVETMLENGEVDEQEYKAFAKVLEQTTGVTQQEKDGLNHVVTEWYDDDNNTKS